MTSPPQPLPPYLQGLNAEQRAAVEAMDGAVLLLAGAGTGKTRALTTRLAHLLWTRRAHPGEILAVTFTNKAAREMKDRVAALLGRPSVEGWWLGTFHALAARILRQEAEGVGLKSNFTILDPDDQLRLLKQVMAAEQIDEKAWPPKVLLSIIERWKDRGLTPDRVPAAEVGEFAKGRSLKLYAAYQERLKTLNACDFGDLLLHNLTLFQTRPEVAQRWQQRFRYLLVDEYQDTNVAQYLWLRLLALPQNNICCVGDDDQCLVAGTPVRMEDGSERAIESIRAGDRVLSAYGSGRYAPARVLKVHRRRYQGPIVQLRTHGGRSLRSTPEHVHFAGYRLGTTPQTFFVYLMFKEGIGYRLGTSQVYTRGQVKPMVGFKQRALQEHADALWIVSTHERENDARAQEILLSLRYALPTLPFVPRKGGSTAGLVHDEVLIRRVYAALDTPASAERLMADVGLSPQEPHHVPRSRNANRRNLVLTLCGDRRGATPMHRISIVGNDAAGAEALRQLGFSVRAAKSEGASWRVETANRSFDTLMSQAARMGQAFALRIVRHARLGAPPASGGREYCSLPFLSAGALRPGMAVFTPEGYDTIESIEVGDDEVEVVDLDIENTHNFVAGGIVTHNSIYGWRGAEVENILRFERDFPDATVIRLERNYRSTPTILGAASGLIARNEGRLGKTLWTEGEPGEPVRVRGLWDGEAEARFVGEEIEQLQRQGHSLAEIAILVRTGAQTREFEERFVTLGLPYRVIGGPRFYERLEVRDALAYLRLIQSADDDLAFERICNKPRRGLGEAALRTLHAAARAGGVSLFEAARRLVQTDELRPQARRALGDFVRSLERWRERAAGMPHPELAEEILEESGYVAMWQEDRSIEAPGRLENLKALIEALAEFDSLAGFLEHVSLVMENLEDSSSEQVTLMTLHAAKGLEFDTVFLPGWEEGLFPNQRALDEQGNRGLEEERRLAYVGLTRARQRAIVSFAANRRLYGSWAAAIPSRFVDEIPEEHRLQESDQGLYGTAHQAWGGGGFGGFQDWGGTRWSPGMERARTQRERAGGAAPLIEGSARTIESLPREDPRFTPGTRVFHRKFGYGTVSLVEGERLTIAFDQSGEKKVVAGFLVPAAEAG